MHPKNNIFEEKTAMHCKWYFQEQYNLKDINEHLKASGEGGRPRNQFLLKIHGFKRRMRALIKLNEEKYYSKPLGTKAM